MDLDKTKERLRGEMEESREAQVIDNFCLPGVNFINILHANFLYESLFGSFSLVTCKKKKPPKRRLYKKFACKMLVKSTPGGKTSDRLILNGLA